MFKWAVFNPHSGVVAVYQNLIGYKSAPKRTIRTDSLKYYTEICRTSNGNILYYRPRKR